MDLPGTGVIWVGLGIVVNVFMAIAVVVATRPTGTFAHAHGKVWAMMIALLAMGAVVAWLRGMLTKLRWGAAG
jgi:hypothetical protein